MQESSSSVKICLGVDNVKELLTLRDQARDAGKYLFGYDLLMALSANDTCISVQGWPLLWFLTLKVALQTEL
jgi:hypothetical protein